MTRIDLLASHETVSGYESFILALPFLLMFAAIGGLSYISEIPLLKLFQYFGMGFVAVSAYAAFLLCKVKKWSMNWKLWLLIWYRMWAAFAFAVAIFGIMWFGFLNILNTYSPKFAAVFSFGLYLSLAATAIFPLYTVFFKQEKLIGGEVKFIEDRKQIPELWEAVEKNAPSYEKKFIKVCKFISERGQAYTFGLGFPLFAVIGISENFIKENNLNHDDVEAILAHELGHVVNKGNIITLGLMFVPCFLRIIFLLVLLTSWLYVKFVNPWNLLFFDMCCMGIYFAATTITDLISAYVGRQGEYAADATAVLLQGNSVYFEKALAKISGESFSRLVTNLFARALGLPINKREEKMNPLSDHPSPRNRIKLIRRLQR